MGTVLLGTVSELMFRVTLDSAPLRSTGVTFKFASYQREFFINFLNVSKTIDSNCRQNKFILITSWKFIISGPRSTGAVLLGRVELMFRVILTSAPLGSTGATFTGATSSLPSY